MKITSDTLYTQWRSLTTLCPKRCDPRWIDLSITPIVEGEFLDAVMASQASAKGVCGYEFFLSEISELLEEMSALTIPKVGAGHLSMKYQAPKDKNGDAYFYDYFIVPKLSRVSSIHMAPDDGFSLLKRQGRFTLAAFGTDARQLLPSKLHKKITEDYFDEQYSVEDYENLPPLPDSALTIPRRGTAEQEWFDLLLLANYVYTKNSVQLLYMPVSGPAYDEVGLHDDIAQVSCVDSPRDRLPVYQKATLRERPDHGRKFHSPDVYVTANALIETGWETLIAPLRDRKHKGFSPEEFTDAVSDRELVNDRHIREHRNDAQFDQQEFMANNPLKSFIFSRGYPTVIRDANPAHPSRNDDDNKEYLYQWDVIQQDPVGNFMVSVYDKISNQFVSRSLPEWQTECLIDNVPLMPLQLIPDILSRGATVDDILYLSTMINQATPEEQAGQIVEKFFTEEAQLRLR